MVETGREPNKARQRGHQALQRGSDPAVANLRDRQEEPSGGAQRVFPGRNIRRAPKVRGLERFQKIAQQRRWDINQRMRAIVVSGPVHDPYQGFGAFGGRRFLPSARRPFQFWFRELLFPTLN